MSASDDLINFDIIESQKENIQAIPSGRSARALANLFSASPLQPLATPNPSDTKTVNDAVRADFEAELELLAESDDPLDIYDRYVRWTMDAYPSAQATPQSQLLPLLEAATKTFLSSPQYKNDPRYLKLWLSYIRFFSDSPRETYAFLSRHGVGDGLALFYEEFAAWLETAGRWTQAEEVYNMGMEKDARPAPRLLRKYNEFQQRFAAQPEESRAPSSPALPTVRPALAAKIDPYASAAAPPVDPQAPRPNSGVGGSQTSRNGRPKLAVFSDADESAPVIGGSGAKGWDSIGSLAERRKENVVEAKPWVGETMKAGAKKSTAPKMAVFKDQSIPISKPQVSSSEANSIIAVKEQVTINAKGRSERIFADLEAMYPTPEIVGSERCSEELMAAEKGWLDMNWEPEISHVVVDQENERFDVFVGVEEMLPTKEPSLDRSFQDKLVIARDPPMVDENGVAIEPPKHGRGRRIKTMEVNETQIIKTKLSSPTAGKKVKRRANAEPTMTFHTKAATDDIYELFNQPLQSEEASEEEESESESDDDETDDEYTTEAESTGTGRLVTTSEAGDDETTYTKSEVAAEDTSDVKSVSEWSEFTARKHIPGMEDEDDDDDDTRASHLSEDGHDDAILESSQDHNNATLESSQDHDDAILESSREADSTSHDDEDEAFEQEEVSTPISPEHPESAVRTMFVPIPPEDYVAPTRPFRDASQVSQNRLPFMTPIAEKTESSLGAFTVRAEKEEFISKTPSKANGQQASSIFRSNDRLDSSPFQEVVDEPLPLTEKIPPPALGVVTKNKALPSTKPATNGAAFSRDIATKGPIIQDQQCNPVDDYTRTQIFAALQPPLTTYEGYFDHSEETHGKSAELKKFAKAVAKMKKNASEKTTTNIAMPPMLRFPGVEREYMVKRELGAGAFAPVYLIETVTDTDATTDSNSNAPIMGRGAFSLHHRQPLEALKMEDPPTAWEFYIMRQASRRLGVSRAADSLIHAHEFHLYRDECYLIETYRDQGTLLDLVNIARADSQQAGGVMDELLAMFFAIELLRTVEALHKAGILHGDLKADNVLVRLGGGGAAWSTQYAADGSSGWSEQGVALIDFGRGVDMKVFRPDVQFIADWKTGPQDCAEMRELRPWTYQIDYHGLAGILHSMLFGRYMETVADARAALPGQGAGKRWRCKEGMKRYWQGEIWGDCFDLLLNPTAHVEGEEGGRMPVLRGLRGVRERMEGWVGGNCERGVGLQSMLRKLENSIQGRK
ncbi:BUB protein kinase [Pseudogymnoascus sp. 03VT05]|nr:BUB protein kinase [Pseudogymnoascus sp. 03VT05]